jgi:hypothetical protein
MGVAATGDENQAQDVKESWFGQALFSRQRSARFAASAELARKKGCGE